MASSTQNQNQNPRISPPVCVSVKSTAVVDKAPSVQDRFQEMFLFPAGYAYKCYTRYVGTQISGKASEKHLQFIFFEGDTITVNGKDHGKIGDPINASFMESLLNDDLPDEFDEEGLHAIQILRAADVGPCTPEDLEIRPGELDPMINFYTDSDSDSD